MAGQFRITVLDPVLILSQIITIQSLFYISLTVLIFIVECLYSESPSLNHVFSYNIISIKSLQSVLMIIVYLINSVAG